MAAPRATVNDASGLRAIVLGNYRHCGHRSNIGYQDVLAILIDETVRAKPTMEPRHAPSGRRIGFGGYLSDDRCRPRVEDMPLGGRLRSSGAAPVTRLVPRPKRGRTASAPRR